MAPLLRAATTVREGPEGARAAAAEGRVKCTRQRPAQARENAVRVGASGLLASRTMRLSLRAGPRARVAWAPGRSAEPVREPIAHHDEREDEHDHRGHTLVEGDLHGVVEAKTGAAASHDAAKGETAGQHGGRRESVI